MIALLLAAVIGTLLLVAQPARMRYLLNEVRGTTVALALLAVAIQSVGFQTEGPWGHALVAASMAGFAGVAWSLRHWPGGWLLVLGVVLNGVAISAYGRMPIADQVLAQLNVAYPVGAALAASKDVVAQGVIATWLGDRFILALPFIPIISVWSLGDCVLLGGICRAAFAKVPA